MRVSKCPRTESTHIDSALLRVERNFVEQGECFRTLASKHREEASKWCESTLLEDVARGALRAVSAPPARNFAFCVFGPFETSKNAFREKMGNTPSIIFLILQNLDSICELAQETSCHRALFREKNVEKIYVPCNLPRCTF